VPSPAADRIVITNEDLRNVRLLPPTYAGVPPTVAEQRRRAQEVLRHQTTVKPKDWIDEDKCPFCLCDMDPGQHVVVCPECGLAHHADCWEENEGCCTFGCKLAPLRHSLGPPVAAPAQAARTSSMPVIAGDQRRRCSNCGRFLPLGETRCRHCEGRPAFVVPSDAAGRSLVAGRTLGRAIFAICWAVLAMILVLGALPPVAARIPLSLAVIAPGFVAAVSAISRASKISSAVAGDSSTSGQGRAALATVLGVIAVLLSLIAFFGGIARSYG
jgi:hypothetical protein